MRRPFPLICLVLGCLLARAEKPNVIFILTDDQGYGDISAHGNPILKTPKLDSLHAESIRFTDFHVAPMCTPTRGELMTGIDAFRNGATAVCQGRSMPRRELKMMPQYFKDNGYATGHFGKWHLGDSYPYRPHDRGFDISIHNKAWGIGSLSEHWENNAFDDQYWHNNEIKRYEGYNTDVFFGEAIKWIEKQKGPFFAFIPTTAAHSPFVVPEKYSAPYRDKVGRVEASFFGMIANIDENIAKLDAFLEKKGLKENTILIFMTDNGTVRGDKIFNAGMRGKKTSAYEGGHRVPCFLRWPAGGYNKGRDIHKLSHSTDILPTLFDLCGFQFGQSPDLDGTSLLPLLHGNNKALADRKLVIQYRHEYLKYRGAILWKKWRMVDGKELYNLGNDPGQKNNVYDQHPDIVKSMREHYERWHGKTEPVMEQPNYVSVGTPHEEITWLTSCNWTDSYADNWGNLRSQSEPGHWKLLPESSGKYLVSMYMFHPDANTPLNGTLRGVGPRPVKQAQMILGEKIFTKTTSDKDTHVDFEIELKQGQKVNLEGRFLDANGKILSGAFYTYLRRKGVGPDDLRKFVAVKGAPRKKAPAPAPRRNSVKAAGNEKIPADALLLADFEGNDWGDWKTTGKAFGTGPTATKNRVQGYRGKTVADTYLINESDGPTGTLTSPNFKIERQHINLLIGGGRHPGSTGARLIVDGKTVRSATGNSTKNEFNRKVLTWVSWNVGEWMGKEARIEIYDQKSGGWGHIVVDHIFQSKRTMARRKK